MSCERCRLLPNHRRTSAHLSPLRVIGHATYPGYWA